MNEQQLKLFMDVVESGSFSKTAERHYVSPQSVSQQIRRLEDELGFDLLVRTSRGVTPTEAGQTFYEGCRRISHEFDELSERCSELAGAPHQNILLGISEKYSLALFSKFVPTYLRTHPSAHIEYVEVGASPVDELRLGRFDVIEGVDPETNGTDNDGLAFCPLMKSRRCCLVSSSNPLSRLASVGPDDLRSMRLYVFNREWAANLQAFLRESCPDAELQAIPSADYQTIIRLCRASDAAFLMPEHLVGRYEPLIPVPLDIDVVTEYGLLFLTSMEPRLAELLDAARTAFEVEGKAEE